MPSLAGIPCQRKPGAIIDLGGNKEKMKKTKVEFALNNLVGDYKYVVLFQNRLGNRDAAIELENLRCNDPAKYSKIVTLCNQG